MIVRSKRRKPPRRGLAVARGRRRLGRGMAGMGGPLVWTPNAITSLRDQVDAEIQALARDVSAERARTGQDVIDNATLSSWKAFYNEWAAYRDSVGWFWGLWGTTVDRYQDFRARALDWRRRMQGAGARFSTPAPNVAPPSAAPDLLKWGLVVAGGYLAVRVASEAGILRRAGRVIGGKP